MVLKDRASAIIGIMIALALAILAAILLRFEMVSTARNSVARLDHWTGSIVLCDESGCLEPPVGSPARSTWRDKVVEVQPDGSGGGK